LRAPIKHRIMRVLVADRNVRLLESISLTFAFQHTIHTASTLQRCTELLQQTAFDLVIVCEKLADGPGLSLLGHIVQNSPDTLRVFAARPATLQRLKGKLGRFGLFRTLSYPIEPRKLLSALTLAQAGLLQIETPAEPLETSRVIQPQPAPLPVPPYSPSPVRLKSPPPLPPQLPPPVPLSVPLPPQPRGTQHPRSNASHSQPMALILARLQPPKLIPPRFTAPRIQHPGANPSRLTPPRLPLPTTPSAAPRPTVALAHPPSPASLQIPATAHHPTRPAKPTDAPLRRSRGFLPATPAAPKKRPRAFLAAAAVAAFVLTMLTLRQFDAAAQSSNMRAIPTAKVDRLAALRTSQRQSSDTYASSPDLRPTVPTPSVAVTPGVAEPTTVLASQPVPDSTPIADPSTFGSEAAEPIYSN